MTYLIGFAVVLLAIAGIAGFVREDRRYATMTEEEFEAEARRSSALGGVMLELQRIVSSGKNVEYMMQQDKHEEGNASESGDPPSRP